MHHVHPAGLGLKNDTYENLSSLCHGHHMEITAVGSSKAAWAARHFWGATYRQYGEYIGMRRRMEMSGNIPDPDIRALSPGPDAGLIADLVARANKQIDDLLRLDGSGS